MPAAGLSRHFRGKLLHCRSQHDLLVPYLAFTQDDFEAELPNITEGGVASHEYTLDESLAAITANMK